jgi:proton-dependent oligopeptide transporter, POT family
MIHNMFSKFRFPRSFWVANVMELFERLAWYGVLIVLPLYLTGSLDEGALGFSQARKGFLMGFVGMVGYILPLFTGTIADRWGFRRTLILSYVILIAGYFLMGQFQTYYGIMMAFLLVATGAALFKPIIAATVARLTNDGNSSLGFGIFYMMVNIGAFVGPILAAKARLIEWHYIFWLGSAAILVNLLLVLFLYRMPEEKMERGTLTQALAQIFRNILSLFRNWRYVIFLLIIAGFWTMYLQLFISLPNFIDQWVDTRGLYNALHNFSPWLAQKLGDAQKGIIPAEIIVNADAMYIIVFQLFISALVMKWKPLNTIITGILIATLGLSLTFIQHNAFFFFVSILIFAVGEMAASPKITEYIGKIAPPSQVAFYIGTSYLPLGLGYFLAGILAGNVYGQMSDKVYLTQLELQKLGIAVPELSQDFTQNDLYSLAEQQLGFDSYGLSQHLWDAWEPWRFFYVIAAVGLFTVLALLVYDRTLARGRSQL